MCRCIYTGSVEVKPDMAQDLLRAADQYLLEQLKRLCEECISKVCSTLLALVACRLEQSSSDACSSSCSSMPLEEACASIAQLARSKCAARALKAPSDSTASASDSSNSLWWAVLLCSCGCRACALTLWQRSMSWQRRTMPRT